MLHSSHYLGKKLKSLEERKLKKDIKLMSGSLSQLWSKRKCLLVPYRSLFIDFC